MSGLAVLAATFLFLATAEPITAELRYGADVAPGRLHQRRGLMRHDGWVLQPDVFVFAGGRGVGLTQFGFVVGVGSGTAVRVCDRLWFTAGVDWYLQALKEDHNKFAVATAGVRVILPRPQR